MSYIHRLMHTRPLYWVILFILGVTGCSSSIGYMEPFDAKGQRIALITLVPEKHIEFCETTPTGAIRIFLKVTDNMYAFKEIWEPEVQIEASIMQGLTSDEKLRGISIATCSGSDGYNNIVSICESAYDKSRERQEAILSRDRKAGLTREWYNSPPKEYLYSPLPKEACIAAESLGADYLLEITLAGIAYEVSRGAETNRAGIDFVFDMAGPSRCWIGLYGRIIRVSDGKVIRCTSAESSDYVKGVKSFSDLEADNLKMIKTHFKQGLQTILVKKNLLKKLLL